MPSRPTTLTAIVLLMLVALTSAGCEAIEAVFKAGIWVGLIVVILIVALVGVVWGRLRRP